MMSHEKSWLIRKCPQTKKYSNFASKRRRSTNFPVDKIQIIELTPRGELIPWCTDQILSMTHRAISLLMFRAEKSAASFA